MSVLMISAIVVAVAAFISLVTAMAWRVVVPTDHVHIVQRRKGSTAYGQNAAAGNVYFNIPSHIPYFGVVVSKFTTAIFPVKLEKYDAYDAARVPFMVDVLAYCRVSDAVLASQRISNFEEMEGQLQGTMRGAVRRVLASQPINEIMGSRATLREEFQKEVAEQMAHWGVLLNSIEFMNLDDFPNTKVITNIMDKERTTIEKESRVRVAENMREAQLAEILAKQTVELKDVERQRVVALETEKAAQTVKEQKAITTTKELAVVEIDTVRRQEINKRAVELDADAKAEAIKREAAGYKNAVELKAEADAKRVHEVGSAEAKVVEAKGLADAASKSKMAEALQKYNDAALGVEGLRVTESVEKAKWAALGAGLSAADIKLVMSPSGAKVLGLPLDVEGGAALSGFMSQLPASLKDKAEALVKSIAKTKKTE